MDEITVSALVEEIRGEIVNLDMSMTDGFVNNDYEAAFYNQTKKIMGLVDDLENARLMKNM